MNTKDSLGVDRVGVETQRDFPACDFTEEKTTHLNCRKKEKGRKRSKQSQRSAPLKKTTQDKGTRYLTPGLFKIRKKQIAWRAGKLSETNAFFNNPTNFKTSIQSMHVQPKTVSKCFKKHLLTDLRSKRPHQKNDPSLDIAKATRRHGRFLTLSRKEVRWLQKPILWFVAVLLGVCFWSVFFFSSLLIVVVSSGCLPLVFNNPFPFPSAKKNSP